MRRGLTISLIVVIICLVITGTWLAKLLWFKPLSINHFFERVYIEFLWEDPEALSQTGVLEPFGMSGYESELTDVSPTATRRLGEVGKRNLDLLNSYNRKNLEPNEQVSYDVLKWFLEVGVKGEPFLFHDYPVTHISGPHLDLPRFMRSHPLDTKADIENYLQRLAVVDEKFGSLIDGLEERRRLGVVAPSFIIQRAIKHCQTMTEDDGIEEVFYKPFAEKITSIALLNPKSKQAYLDECEKHISESVMPSYKRLEGYLLQLERSSLSIAGVWQLPNGGDYYQFCILQNTGANNSPDELYELGKLEMSRLKGELTLLLELVGSDVGDRDPLLISRSLDESSESRFQDSEEGRSECLEFFQKETDRIGSLLGSYFQNLPATELSVIEVPERSSANRPLAFYIPPRTNSVGKLYINTWKTQNLTSNLARSYAYHEGVPGHHLQKSIQVSLTDLPTFRRFLPFEAFTEGWAMYAEQLGHEMTETDDLWDRIGLIQSDLFRTARMMTDIGIHHKKWLRQQAIEFMLENTNLSLEEATDEVDRYIVWPGQGCAYKVGQMKFQELREMAQIELRDDFDIKEFHEVLIGNGAMPLTVLEAQVQAYIAANKRND